MYACYLREYVNIFSGIILNQYEYNVSSVVVFGINLAYEDYFHGQAVHLDMFMFLNSSSPCRFSRAEFDRPFRMG